MRRGVVLFITLAILMMLASVVFLFLRQSDAVKKSVRSQMAAVQTNLILSDLSGYLKGQNFTQDDIFYGAGIPVALEVGALSGTLAIDSAQNRVDLNALLAALPKDQATLEAFLAWLEENQRLKDPQLMLALLLDTMDTDLYERERGSEIRRTYPWFQNGTIANARALALILETYRNMSGDAVPRLEDWLEIFGFDGADFDLNYASMAQLRLLYPDLPDATLSRLAAHNNRYTQAEDLPVAEEYKEALMRPHMGITPVLSSRQIAVAVDFETPQECKGRLSFRMALKKRRITHLSLSPILCP
ncbi:hypothetical protein [Hydrogenimonas sp.]